MATLLVLYKIPTNAAAFDEYYAQKHVPLAKKIPGLRGYRVSRGAITTPGGVSGLHLVATLTFDTMTALQAGLGSAEGRAAAADVPNFASAGAELYMFDDAAV